MSESATTPPLRFSAGHLQISCAPGRLAQVQLLGSARLHTPVDRRRKDYQIGEGVGSKRERLTDGGPPLRAESVRCLVGLGVWEPLLSGRYRDLRESPAVATRGPRTIRRVSGAIGPLAIQTWDCVQ